jgi:tRNA pseudouridine55 synthase
VLLLDKPQGCTSNAALQEVKGLFEAAKAGHTGSLDPLATGVLPLCFGEGTKFSQFLLDANKRYIARFKLGIATDSGDADGRVLETRDASAVTRDAIENLLDDFRGEIEQIPSMYSALKHKGEPLYKLARRGIEVERKSRKATIFQLEMIEFSVDEFVLDIVCSKGTYVRSIAEDMGERLGCGAHICELRRVAAGPYQIEDAFTLDELKQIKAEEGVSALDGCLLEVASALAEWPAISLTESTAFYLKQGQAVQVSNAPLDGYVRLFSGENDQDADFIGVGEIQDDGKIAPRRLLSSQR